MPRANLVRAACVLPFLLAAPARGADPAPDAVRRAVEKSLPLLLKGAEGHVEQRTCFACHNQAVPMLAFTTARARGFAVRDEDVQKQLDFVAEFLGRHRENFQKGQGTGGQVDSAGYALLTLELGGWKPDATTAAVAEYLLLRDKDRDHWRTVSNRPPSEASLFTPNYFALRGLKAYGTPEQRARIAQRVEAVRAWLLKAPARDTEDRVFRLWALKAVGADDAEVRAAAEALLQTQREDGGWGQLDTMESDAYATGSALVALHEAGGLTTDDEVYRNGLAYLLAGQQEDGSWLVRSRSRPFQTYYESGFPHKKDQFISIAASAWATAALALACPPSEKPKEAPR
jgi:hypothetical protein